MPRRSEAACVSCNLKTFHPFPVRTLLSQLSEAEISGDTAVVRSLLSTLASDTLFLAKIFIFTDDVRPGYFGTWTRSSRFVGPRTPFAKDIVALDYAYDSGEEWEEEDAGNGDDVVEDGEDDEGGEVEDDDSDLDSWLVDDDEVVDTEERTEVSSMSSLPLPMPMKRKMDDGDKKLGKKRKVVIPLVPFARGPCWEENVGSCKYDPFTPYKIQFFNGWFFFCAVSNVDIHRQMHHTRLTLSPSSLLLSRKDIV
jgi:chromatin assembly factor 1 subunit A